MSDAEATTKPMEATPTEVKAPEAAPAEATSTEATSAEAASAETTSAETTSAEQAPAATPAEESKTTAKIDHKDVKKNNKFDPSVREVTDDPVAIRKQVSCQLIH